MRFPINEAAAVADGWTEYPSDRVSELKSFGVHTFGYTNCELATPGTICGQYTDGSGKLVISVCRNGFCGKFLREP